MVQNKIKAMTKQQREKISELLENHSNLGYNGGLCFSVNEFGVGFYDDDWSPLEAAIQEYAEWYHNEQIKKS